MKRVRTSDLRDDVRLIRLAELRPLLDGVTESTIDDWIKNLGFPKPIYIKPGSPKRFRLAEVRRWLDRRAAKRHVPIHRGRLRRGTE